MKTFKLLVKSTTTGLAFIEAKNKKEAIKLAKAGHFDEIVDGGEEYDSMEPELDTLEELEEGEEYYD